MADMQWRRFRLFVVVVALGAVAAIAAAGGAADSRFGPKSVAASQTATITVKSVYFEPYDLKLTAGVPVVLEYVNDGTMKHDLVIDGINEIDAVVAAGSSKDPAPPMKPGSVRLVAEKGQSVRVTFIPRAGKFDFYCSDAGHRGAGLRGTILVE